MYIIIGAGGFLGSYLIKTAIEKTNEKILASSRNGAVYGADNSRVEVFAGELTDEKYLSALAEKINECENAKIVFTAACHNIDFVAENPEKAYNMNIEMPKKLLSQIRCFEKLLFTSSDTVYGEGGAYPFREDDELKPISVYGAQKAQAEKVFISHGGTALRLPLMFSESIAPAKKHFCDVLFENMKNGKTTQLVKGAVRSTLDYGTVADIIIGLCEENELPEIINIAGDEAFSKYELGVRFAQCNGLDTAFLVAVDAFGAPPADGAKRTDSTLMSNKLLKSILKRDEIKIKF